MANFTFVACIRLKCIILKYFIMLILYLSYICQCLFEYVLHKFPFLLFIAALMFTLGRCRCGPLPCGCRVFYVLTCEAKIDVFFLISLLGICVHSSAHGTDLSSFHANHTNRHQPFLLVLQDFTIHSVLHKHNHIGCVMAC